MKKDIHPKYYPKTKVTCACGNSFEVGSTVPEINVEVCSACHPYYTGKHKLLDTQKRVDKFKARLAKAEKFKKKDTKKTSKAKSADLSAETRKAKVEALSEGGKPTPKSAKRRSALPRRQAGEEAEKSKAPK